FPDGVIAPAWPEADASLEDLFAVVMDPTVPRAAAADRARQWLDGIPRAAAWINDDAGALGVRLHVAELRGEGDLVAARAAPSASCDPATLHPLLPRTVAEIDLRCRQRPASRSMRVDVGDWSSTLEASAAPREVGPPGARVGPLLLPHSMRTLLAGQVAVPDAAHATAALIQRAPGEDRWRLYAECLAPEGESAEGEDTLRVFFGVREFPRLVLEIQANGPSARIAYD